LNMDSLSVTSLNLREKLVNLLKSHTAPSLRGLITFTLSTYADKPSDIYTMRADGFAVPMPLEIGEINGWTYQDKTPRISIDGRSVFTESADGDLELFVRSADGSETLQITDNEAQDSDPKWSPNGDRIVFVSDRDGDSEIFVTNKDGSKIIQITDNEVRDWDPKWSPDGKEIVFLSVPNGNEGEIFVTSSDGLETRQITDNGFWNESPVWSPDGQHIAFSSNFARCEDQATARRCMQIPWLATDIFVMKADGTDVQPLTDLTDDQMGYKVFEWSD
jgi:Tol biopolymer transport system component